MNKGLANARVDLNVVQKFDADGKIQSISYYKNDFLHNDHGPAHIGWHPDGMVIRQEHWCMGKMHREDGPAFKSWYPDGKIKNIEYWVNDQLHREDGPAILVYSEGNTQIERVEYWVDGVEFTKEEWDALDDEDALPETMVINGRTYQLVED